MPPAAPPPLDYVHPKGYVCYRADSPVKIDGRLDDPRDVDRGWPVELAFPWAVLKEMAHRPAPPCDGDQWRVNFSRVEWRHEVVNGRYRRIKGLAEDNWVWSPQGVVDMHQPEMW